MQLDMHYHGTYAMARAAGLTEAAAKMIATCAQFVDDNVARGSVEFRDGARIDAEATAHHAVDVENLDPHDQRRVWVPFHFLPGNQGESYTERLKCRMDSQVVQDVRDHHLTLAGEPYALALMGITAHVYADTFSHYGFSGVSSRGNRVDNKNFRFGDDLEPEMHDYLTGKAARFFRDKRGGGTFANIKSWLGETFSGALGHGSVATYPDRPYLTWSFAYERDDAVHGRNCSRDNQTTFLAGCRALHEMFRRFAEAGPAENRSGDGRDFDEIEARVAAVLATQANKAGRIAAWREAARTGAVFGADGADIPDYEGTGWNARWDEMDGSEHGGEAFAEPVWLFYQAAALHRTYVLRDLLPSYSLIVN
jgi:hypothetical protein